MRDVLRVPRIINWTLGVAGAVLWSGLVFFSGYGHGKHEARQSSKYPAFMEVTHEVRVDAAALTAGSRAGVLGGEVKAKDLTAVRANSSAAASNTKGERHEEGRLDVGQFCSPGCGDVGLRYRDYL